MEGWRERLEARGISVVMSGHNSAHPRGGDHMLAFLSGWQIKNVRLVLLQKLQEVTTLNMAEVKFKVF